METEGENTGGRNWLVQMAKRHSQTERHLAPPAQGPLSEIEPNRV